MASKKWVYVSPAERTAMVVGRPGLLNGASAYSEMLAHLSYEGFPRTLTKIHRLSGRYAVLSLPDSTRAYRLDIQIPKIGELKRLIPLPRLKPPKHVFDGEHYWEVGKAGYPLQKIMGEMRRAGFEIKKTSRVFEMPYHRFFVLAKSEKKD